MSIPSGIQGQILEVTVVGCYKLRDTEWISRQDPYVCLEYASTRFRTRTCTDGGKNPTFNEKFMFTLIEGLREINVHVWNSNTISHDDFIGSGKILLQKVLSQGYDDSTWPVQTKGGRHGGEVRVIMHYATTGKPGKPTAAAAPSPYPAPYPTQYPAPYPAPATAYTPPPSYPAAAYPPYGPPPPTAYAPSPYPSQSTYPPPPATYPPAPYPPPQPNAYPPPAYPPQTYPPQTYPPPAYPPGQTSYPPAAFPGIYPPPPSY